MHTEEIYAYKAFLRGDQAIVSQPIKTKLIDTGNLFIYSRNDFAPNAILLAHGAYFNHGGTPLSSGTISVPPGLNVALRASLNESCYDREISVFHWLAEFCRPISLERLMEMSQRHSAAAALDPSRTLDVIISEIKSSGEQITDYFMTTDYLPCDPAPGMNCDIIIPKPNKYVHMRDVFRVRSTCNRRWTTLYGSFCRNPFAPQF